MPELRNCGTATSFRLRFGSPAAFLGVENTVQEAFEALQERRRTQWGARPGVIT